MGIRKENSDKGGLEAWRGLVEMGREGISRGADDVSKTMKVVLMGANLPLIRNVGHGDVSPRLEREVKTGLECQEIIINSQNDPHCTLIICHVQASG